MLRDREYLADILESARLACQYVAGKTKRQFLRDVQCQDSVIRRLEVIGEAARRVSADGRASMPELPWPQMVGLRNVMIHEYDAVDLTVVWDTVRKDLPPLIESLQSVVPPPPPEPEESCAASERA
jgi:uncharacterized protein with HEPN domain